MPGVLPSNSNGLSRGTPSKKSRLSLKLFQKRETKRALDFTESQENEHRSSEYESSEIDQVVPAAQSLSPVSCEKKDNMLPFVGLNNLGNTCYLNSILQVLYFCPGFKPGVKQLFNIISKKKESLKDETNKGLPKEDSLADDELICSLHSLIVSVEQLQASFLLNTDKYTDELATQPRRLLNTLRKLNPMYEGYLQHDAQEVLQCILGHIQETCQLLKEEKQRLLEEPTIKLEKRPNNNSGGTDGIREDSNVLDGQANKNCENKSKGNGKRKRDMEDGNEKKKSKVTKEKNTAEENQRRTRSKKRALEEKLEIESEAIRHCIENEITKPSLKKSLLRFNWFSGIQPSILSKFCSLGKLTTNIGSKDLVKEMEISSLTDVSLKSEDSNQAGKEYCDSSSAMEHIVGKETAVVEKKQRG